VGSTIIERLNISGSSILTDAWLPELLLTTTTPVWSCSKKVFAGSTKNMSVGSVWLVQACYRNAQDAAQAQKTGLWQDAVPVPPWEWRKEKRVLMQLASLL
jgi:hypothetical protein